TTLTSHPNSHQTTFHSTKLLYLIAVPKNQSIPISDSHHRQNAKPEPLPPRSRQLPRPPPAPPLGSRPRLRAGRARVLPHPRRGELQPPRPPPHAGPGVQGGRQLERR